MHEVDNLMDNLNLSGIPPGARGAAGKRAEGQRRRVGRAIDGRGGRSGSDSRSPVTGSEVLVVVVWCVVD